MNDRFSLASQAFACGAFIVLAIHQTEPGLAVLQLAVSILYGVFTFFDMYDTAPPASVVLVLASMLFALNAVVIRDSQLGVDHD